MKKLLAALLFPIAAHAQSVTVVTPPHTTTNVTIQSQPNNLPCEMAAADIRIFADDYQAGVPLSAELKRYGNHDFRRSMIQQTYQISAKSGGSPADIQQAAYEQCAASSESN